LFLALDGFLGLTGLFATFLRPLDFFPGLNKKHLAVHYYYHDPWGVSQSCQVSSSISTPLFLYDEKIGGAFTLSLTVSFSFSGNSPMW